MEKIIQRKLFLKLNNVLEKYGGKKYRYILPNVYFFSEDWETDILTIENSNHTTEFELKSGIQDLAREKAKIEKHKKLSGRYGFIPNKFYLVVPDTIAHLADFGYNGIIVYDKRLNLTIRKIAPYLHKNPITIDQERAVMTKLHNRFWINGFDKSNNKNRKGQRNIYYSQA